MKKLRIGFYIVLLVSLVSFSIMSVYAEPVSVPAETGDPDSAVISENTSSIVTDVDASSLESAALSDSSEKSSSQVESSRVSSVAPSRTSSTFSQKPPSSSRVSTTPSSRQDEDYIYDTDDDDYVQVTSDTLSQPADADGDGIDDEEEAKMDRRLSGRIARVIWIPITLAVASAAALITINVLYRKKYGKLSSGKKKAKKKDKKTNLYIPRD